MNYKLDFFSGVNKVAKQKANSAISLKAQSELMEISQDKARWSELTSWISDLDMEDICASENEDTALAFLIQGLTFDKVIFQPDSVKEILSIGIKSIENYQKAIQLFDEESQSLKLLTEYLLEEKINSRQEYREYLKTRDSDEDLELTTNNGTKCP
ncbi:hypothetical protein [Legionella quateirensis]|uniref:Uncharacterized protein n=1 Tax=Legionella quateirensis TaxID=45072 RepID=A0A378KSZ3_9GAMM|nr:hypothetical protein [Legionella quateirensis]KTD51058.1 hypothetical protein Lqua_1285 [Legionella quateirensis]STY17695.1 Uncharacterised protein [Legionella quateirensis]